MRQFLTTSSGLVIGGVIGLASGVALGIFIAPSRDPAMPLRHEWYTMMVFSYGFWSMIGGAVVGGIVGAFPNRYVFACSTVGLLAGFACGIVLWHYDWVNWSRMNPNDPA